MPDAPVPPAFAASQRLMRERAADWLAVVARRRSRRAFTGEEVDEAPLAELAEFVARWRPYPDARSVLVMRPSTDIFKGVVGSYGKVVGSPHLLVFIGDMRAPYSDQHVGYTGEAVILEATRLGLSTCWVGGFFSAKHVARLVELRSGERVLAVSPLGYARPSPSATETIMASFASADHRRGVDGLVARQDLRTWPTWAIAAVETARLAPSAMNRQPWRFHMDGDALVLSKDNAIETPKVTKRLDVGIAMLHAELAATAHGLRPRWTDLAGIDVARLEVTPA